MPVPLAVAEAALQRFFGHGAFRPGQVDVVEAVLAGHDTLGVLPTGGGKSLCYQVPSLVLGGLTVVISPLISLMKDQVERLVSRGIAAAFLNSTVAAAETSRVMLGARRGILRLLYVAPERFEATDLQRALRESAVSLVAVDEAHCISEWGHEFRPSFRRIAEVAERIGRPQMMALTATATPRVRSDITRQLRLRQPRVIVSGFDRPNLLYAVRPCRGDREKDLALVATLRPARGAAVVYAATRSSVERVARVLSRSGFRASVYHGGLSDGARSAAQEAFMGERLDAIVATNAFGMGIDKPNVRLVIHHAMPGTLEAYYQEAGRAGRDGGPARCLLLYSAADRSTHEWFIRGTFPERETVRRVHGALTSLAHRRRVPLDAAGLARTVGIDAPVVAAALGVLERSGVLVRDPAPQRVRVRLLATAARVARELPADSSERALLAALWPGGHAPSEVRIHLDDLPPGLHGRAARLALRRLRDRQFVDFALLEPDHRLTDRHPDAAVDWRRLAVRRGAELAKLDMMECYARTPKCRREVLLGYFGERATPRPCSGCDNCHDGRT